MFSSSLSGRIENGFSIKDIIDRDHLLMTTRADKRINMKNA